MPEKDFIKVENSYYLYEAAKLGVKANVLGNYVLQLRKGDTVHNVWRCNTDFDGRGSMHIAGDKVHCYSVFKETGIPIPKYVILRSGDYKNVIAFKKKINAPIVIKPARDTGDSAGVFIKPETFYSIWFAANYAGSYGSEIIVEEWFEGTNYRLLFCKGRFLAASSRIPSLVIGDGLCTVRELINATNRGRRKNGDYVEYETSNRPIRYKIPVSASLVKVLKKQGLQLNSVPLQDTIVRLQDVCHWLFGGQYFDVTDIISPELVKVSKKAVQALGIKLAGVDVIAQDIRNPREGTYIINEINTTPALLVHYEVQNQDKMRPVCREILKLMFDME